MSERKYAGGRPKKACFTYKNDEVKLHEDIPTAGAYLGVSHGPGAYIRVMLNREGVYRPRNGGVCWPVGGDTPIEAREVFPLWKLVNP